jgi:hypothetical protein
MKVQLAAVGVLSSALDISPHLMFSKQGISTVAEHTFFLKTAARSAPPPLRQ